MGNHEYCEDCGESNFQVAARVAQREKNEKIHESNVKRMKEILALHGIEYRMDAYGNAIVNPNQFQPQD